MAETREIIGHAQHAPQGPHRDNFVPLIFSIEPEHIHVEVMRSQVIVGRHSDADLRLAYSAVSRHHCRLAFENGQWRLYDLKSTNGVYLNNTRIAEATLYTGDQLYIGSVYLLVKSATPVRLLKTAESLKQDKLRQIVEQLPADQTRRAS